MAEDSGQERTEDATPRRKQQAKEKGQVASSRELNTTIMLIVSGLGALAFGSYIVEDLELMLKTQFTMSRESIFNVETMTASFSDAGFSMLWSITPFLALVTVAAIAGPILLGGLNFSAKAFAFKIEKLDPIKGMKRVFSMRGLVELVKAFFKFVLIGSIAFLFLSSQSENYIALGYEDLDVALSHTGEYLMMGFVIISTVMILIAALDVPFQIWQHNKQLKMTTQEVKDDSKETEGNPEVRGRVRKMQREMAQRRMMQDVPDADVVVTNPEHYAVALKYDQGVMRAPIVVAKGVDLIATQIRLIANEHNVPILEAPPLARALHYSTEIKHPIPEGLFLAVAKVLAYVFQVKTSPAKYKSSHLKMDNLPIPEDLQVD